MALTARQKKFVDELLVCGSEREAAIRAGYSPRSAGAQASRLLKDPAVQKYRRETENRLFEELGVSEGWIGRRLVEIVDRCMQATPHYSWNSETRQKEPDGFWVFDPSGAIKALAELGGHLGFKKPPEEVKAEGQSFEDWLRKQGGGGKL